MLRLPAATGPVMPWPMGERRDTPAAPTVEPEPDMASARGRRPRYRSWLRRAVLGIVVLALLPLVLTLLYAIPFVHPISTLMVKDLAMLRGYDRQWVDIEDVAPVLAHSIVMSEDGQFCSHHGIDWRELKAVLDSAVDSGEVSRGASTITMQTVKNLYLWHRPLGALRKLIEMPYAVYMDLALPKRRNMEIYLNIAEMGPGIYGAEAAARHHFGKAAKNLTRREAALLAASLPNPHVRNASKPGPGMRRIAGIIERRARSSGDYVGCLN